MKLYILCTIIILTFFGCSYKVGGDCNYQKINGQALIINKTKNTCFAQFTPKIINYNIKFLCNDDINIGQTYPAILKKATHSSCNPIILNLTKERK